MLNKKINWNQFSTENIKKLIKILGLNVKYTRKPETLAVLSKLNLDFNYFEDACKKNKITPMTRGKTNKSSNMELRIAQLETTMQIVLKKMDLLEKNILGGSKLKSSRIDQIANIIYSYFKIRKTISVDDLFSASDLTEYSPQEIEQATLKLIDTEQIYTSEGKSIKKIFSNVGRLHRY